MLQHGRTIVLSWWPLGLFSLICSMGAPMQSTRSCCYEMHVSAQWCHLRYLNTHKTQSFSTPGNVIAGQGADFLQQEANRDVKSLLPSGHISSDTWRRVSNAVNDLQELKQDMLNVSNVQTNETQRRYLKLDNEIKMVWIVMRKSCMLSPKETKTPQSLAGKKAGHRNPHYIWPNNYSIYK